MTKKELLFRMTEKDFKFIPTKGRGAGGQARNKRETACICQHESSKAEGYAEDSRNFLNNKRLAFKRCTDQPEFKAWLKLKIDAGMGRVEITETKEDGKEITRKVNHQEIK